MVNTNSNTQRRGWLPLENLPNSHGFRFIGLRKDGEEELCSVTLTPSGTFAVANNMYPLLLGWRPYP